MSDNDTPSFAGEQPLTPPPVPPMPPMPPAQPAPIPTAVYPTVPLAPTPSQTYPGTAPTYDQAPVVPVYSAPAPAQPRYPAAPPPAGHAASPAPAGYPQPGYAVAQQQPTYGVPPQQGAGYPVYSAPAYPVAPPRPTSGLAIASLVCAIVSVVFSWLLLPILAAIAAVITGHMALKQTQNNPAIGGRGVAFAGLIIGYIMLAFLVFGLLLTIVSFVAFGAFTLPFLFAS